MQLARCASGSVWTGADNLVTTEFRSPDLRARTESLDRLSYPGPLTNLSSTFHVWRSILSDIMWTRNLRKDVQKLEGLFKNFEPCFVRGRHLVRTSVDRLLILSPSSFALSIQTSFLILALCLPSAFFPIFIHNNTTIIYNFNCLHYVINWNTKCQEVGLERNTLQNLVDLRKFTVCDLQNSLISTSQDCKKYGLLQYIITEWSV